MKLQVVEAQQLGVWTDICDLKDWNPYILNQGQIDDDEEITLTLDEARQLGILEEK